jgi:hypothetical protein
MFRSRQIADHALPGNRRDLETGSLADRLRDPYRTTSLGNCARGLFAGLAHAHRSAATR